MGLTLTGTTPLTHINLLVMSEIFIPYGGYTSGRELTYCLNSLTKNLRCGYDVTIHATEGAVIPDGVENVVWHKECAALGPYKAQVDILTKTLAYARSCKAKEFYFFYDDVCLLRPTKTLRKYVNYEMARPADIREENRHYDPNKYNPKDLYAQLDRYAEDGRVRDFETHLPRLFNTERLLRLFGKYGISGLFLLPTIYLNEYPDEVSTRIIAQDKAAFYFRDTEKEKTLRNVSEIGEQVWLSYNAMALQDKSTGLYEYLEEHYG